MPAKRLAYNSHLSHTNKKRFLLKEKNRVSFRRKLVKSKQSR
jgi:hypothetical protein